ncbi:MAG: hypothetical protein A2521_16935 [Deltaproteobacteria bacterium RIFOXYD12_FULL_57_12]|nr:MAG: hypothetical protein A2521_16935 [Deltaproteobacteria bacterium RIFOXYD12_FULL_57_12]
MKLPISHDAAVNEWNRFEAYLIRERYAVRDPATGLPLEENLSQILERISSEFSYPGVAEALREGRFITATPFLMNGGNPHTGRSGYYSCYPLGQVGDSTEEIFAMERDLVTIFQHSGGGGIDISKVRPKGALVDNGQGNASGPVSFAKGYSQLSSRISQGGKRRGALMIQADWDIHDIREFITFKGDNPGLYSGCNISINVTDERFWNDDSLLTLIAEYIWKSGDPGLLFTQKSLDNTPVPRKFNPVYSNPCGEYLSTRDTACNLLTVSLPRCLAKNYNDYLLSVAETARLAAAAGNEILDMGGFPPIDRIRENTLKFRPIGIGFTGLQQAMNFFAISYADEEAAPAFAKATQLALMLGSMQGSLDYAKFSASAKKKLEVREWNMEYADRIQHEALDFSRESLPKKASWQNRINRMFATVKELGGLYNSVTTSQAPTGSISQLLRVACTGIEPYFSLVQTRKVKDADDSWKEFTLVPLEFYDYDLQKLTWVEGQTAHKITPLQQIRILEACQTFNHTAVSKTINLPADTSVEDIREMLLLARDSRLKGITMFRDSSMAGVLTDPAAPPPTVDQDFSDLAERAGSTYKFSGPSSLYVTANRGSLGHVREIFLNTTKSGSTLHGMCEALGRVISVALQHDYRLVGKIARTLEDISSDAVWQNLKLGRVYSIPAALAKVLGSCATQPDEKADPDPYVEPSAYSSCHACGKLTVRRNGGCSYCLSCGFSTC